ncbi:nascent polypeptide-associated complex subunit alpha, muscle-specific form-like [Myiozetetes cayanensis]|uniref:nascent polypeptide-associated complex subunit alpha, muscle-specific form-like n=1 Tax=Myiozetetes cayanensis TaxID=478635 RepID=UPI002160D809|nr:nascent polypeptide-associated complex subunit alpha, muscle-specific form-like [Myiozetetes cayanensis]
MVVATGGDLALEGTQQPGVTNDPGDTLGHLNDIYEDATTPVTPVTVSPGGDKVLVVTSSDISVEGTNKPGVTGDPSDPEGHLNDVSEGATTPAGPVPTSPGGDTMVVAPGGDVALEGTAQPGVTGDPSDPEGHLNEVNGDATTPVAPVTVSPGGDKVLVVTSSDVIVEGTAQPGVTSDPRDTLGHLNDINGDATTLVAPVPTSPGSDRMVVAPGGDVALEGTDQPSVTGDPRDTLGRATEVYGDATTLAGPVPTSPAGDKVLVATPEDVALEGTGGSGATNCSGDTLGHLNDISEGATTLMTPVTVSPGGDKVLVATSSDVIAEGTEELGVTSDPSDPGDTLGHLNDVSEGATTPAGLVPTSPGGDTVLVATGSDVSVEGMGGSGATNCSGDTAGRVIETYRGATTSVTPAQGGDNLVVVTQGDITVEGTGQPGVTSDPRDTLGHLNDISEGATTPAGLVPTSPGSDTVLVATPEDVALEGTEQPGVTGDPGDTLGHLNDISEGATTPAGLVPTSPGGDTVLVATDSDVSVEGTQQPGVTNAPGDTLGHLNEVYGDATTLMTPVTVSPGGDKVLVVTSSDVIAEGTEELGVTSDPGDTLGHLNEVSEGATTLVAPVPTSPGSDRMLVAPGGDLALEGTQQPGVTSDPRDTLGHLNEVSEGATTPVSPVTVSPGGDKVLVATPGAVALEGTAQPGVPNCPGATSGRVPEVLVGSAPTPTPTPVTPDPTPTPVTPDPTHPRGDTVMVAPGGDISLGALLSPTALGTLRDPPEVPPPLPAPPHHPQG